MCLKWSPTDDLSCVSLSFLSEFLVTLEDRKIMRIPNLLAVATIATASFVQANPVSRNNKSSGKSTPWPEIPQQATYKQPDGPVYVFPSSVVKGVTSKSVAGSGGKKMTFNQVGDTYTRTLSKRIPVHSAKVNEQDLR